MPVVVYETDIKVSVYHSVGDGPLVGFDSKYAEEPHANTGNKITGFAWDAAKWPSEVLTNQAHFIPTLTDPDLSQLDDSYFQSGVGDNDDLLIESVSVQIVDHVRQWRPRINHGYYYDTRHEHYLFSDDSHIDYASLDDTSTGNFIQLAYSPKTGIPISVRQFGWDRDAGKYTIEKDFQKTIAFTGYINDGVVEETFVAPNIILWDSVDFDNPEFLLDYTSEPPIVWLNNQYCTAVGEIFGSIVGLTLDSVADHDNIGLTAGVAGQEVNLSNSPIDRNEPVQITLEFGGGDWQLWTGVAEFTNGVFDEVQVDYDLGIIRFGDAVAGGIPPFGYTMHAAYTTSVAVEYEPEHARDYIENTLADLNPIRKYEAEGFVTFIAKPVDAASIELWAELPLVTVDSYGPLYIGNEFATIKAKVLSEDGIPVEGDLVTFEIVGVEVGSFGAAGATTTAITNGQGIAKTLYNGPRNITDMGGATDNVQTVGPETLLFIPDYFAPIDSVDKLFLFQVARTDNLLGLPVADLLSFYEDYLDTEGLNGPILNYSIGSLGSYGWIAGAYADKIKWEIHNRLVHGLATPITYESGDLITGKKTVVSQVDADAINPYTGSTPAVSVVQPSRIEVIDTGTEVYFDEALPVVTGITDHKSYLVVGPTRVVLRASVVNERLGTTIYSNEIELLIDIPDSMKGLLQVDALNSLPAGTLLNADYLDQASYDLSPVSLSDTGPLPLGFRIRSPGITLASALDGLTFLNLNPEVQFVTTPSLGHEFRVVL